MNFPLSDRILPDGGPPATGIAPVQTDAGDTFSRHMAAFYERVDAAIALHGALCRNRGLCCRFAEFGHRLYVTEPERRYFAEGMAAEWRPADPDQADCPYHVGGVCTARRHRPLGCRIFYCDEAAQAWQGPEYERFLTELKDIGRAFDLPYFYREWLSALRQGPTGQTIDAGRPETLI